MPTNYDFDPLPRNDPYTTATAKKAFVSMKVASSTITHSTCFQVSSVEEVYLCGIACMCSDLCDDTTFPARQEQVRRGPTMTSEFEVSLADM